LTAFNQAGVSSLRAFTVARRESRDRSDDVLIGQLSGEGRPDTGYLCLIGLCGSWIWFETFEETHQPDLFAVSMHNSRLEEGDDILYLLPSEFQPPIASLLLDPTETWEGSTFTVGLAAALPFVNERGERWIRQRPITDASELQEGESLENNGWNHEHCSVCNKHIRPGHRYFSHPFMEGKFFLCEFCHDRFAIRHSVGEVIYAGVGERLSEED
jgi:hypothetical protein